MVMKKVYEDGWYKVSGYEVYVEDGVIVRGVSADGQRTTYPYIKCKTGGWDNASRCLTVSAFRSRVARETARMI